MSSQTSSTHATRGSYSRYDLSSNFFSHPPHAWSWLSPGFAAESRNIVPLKPQNQTLLRSIVAATQILLSIIRLKHINTNMIPHPTNTPSIVSITIQTCVSRHTNRMSWRKAFKTTLNVRDQLSASLMQSIIENEKILGYYTRDIGKSR
jgi:hypothetical protein